MRVLVCGGRNFHDAEFMDEVLNNLYYTHGIDLVISGMARGADTLAVKWAEDMDVQTAKYPADWAKHGNAAGPIRNRKMLDHGKPDLVVAFPGGVGTADMIRQAKRAGVKVMEPKR